MGYGAGLGFVIKPSVLSTNRVDFGPFFFPYPSPRRSTVIPLPSPFYKFHYSLLPGQSPSFLTMMAWTRSPFKSTCQAHLRGFAVVLLATHLIWKSGLTIFRIRGRQHPGVNLGPFPPVPTRLCPALTSALLTAPFRCRAIRMYGGREG